MGKKLYDVVIIRSLAIVMVVAYHAYGMMYWGNFPSMTRHYTDMYYGINQFALNFRMPLFIFISGYLFAYLSTERGKYPTLGDLAKNKFHRLLIPYVAFSLFYMLTTQSFSIVSLLGGEFSHLWFITMLFWCFVTVGVIRLIPHNKNLYFQLVVLTVSFALLFVNWNFPKIMGIQSLPKWFFWFYLGCVVSPYREKVYAFISKRKYLLVIFLAAYVMELYYTMTHTVSIEQRTGWEKVAHLCIVLFVWYGVNWLIRTFPGKWVDNKVFSELNKTSYGIYVIHYWFFPFLVCATAKRLLPIDALAAEYTILFPLLYLVFSLGLSYIMTKLLLRTKVGRYLIG